MNRKQKYQLLQDDVDRFNETYKIGDKLKLKIDDGSIKEVTKEKNGTVLGGHSAVGWFEEISGCYSLDRVVY